MTDVCSTWKRRRQMIHYLVLVEYKSGIKVQVVFVHKPKVLIEMKN